MKKIVLFLVCMALQACTPSIEIPTDWQVANLKGRVKTYTVEIKDVNSGVRTTSVTYYNEDGYITSEKQYSNRDESEEGEIVLVYARIYEGYKGNMRRIYRGKEDAKGLMKKGKQEWKSSTVSVTAIMYTPDKEEVSTRVFDTAGKELYTRTEEFDKSLTTHSINDATWNLYYDGDGNLTSVHNIELKRQVQDTFQVVNKSYDKHQNIIERELYNANGLLYSQIKMSYEYFD